MARIRSIKPSFFKNEDLAELSFAHRLCFAGLWTAADREGRLEDRPRRLKAELFPYDDVDMDGLLTDLDSTGFIVRYSADGAQYITIPQFLKHQRPKNDEHASVIPAPTCEIPRGKVTTPRGNVTAKCIGGRREEVGGREVGEGEYAADAAPAPPDAVELLAAIWNETTTPPLPACQQLTPKRRKHCKVRLDERSIDEWGEVITKIQASTFCRGANERGWVASFDWVVSSPDVAVKVLEGKYDNRKKTGATMAEPTYAGQDWCQHEPRCHNRTWHNAVVLRDKQAASA